MQSIIVKFMAFRNWTLFYTTPKNIKYGVRIKLDVTKDCYNFLVSTRKIVNNCPEKNYVYTDINCRLKVILVDESQEL